MHRMGAVFVLLAITPALGACGSSSAATPSPATPGAAAEAPIDKSKLPKWKLGHYSTPDGLVGMTIDRTGKSPKLKVDGGKDVVELFMEKAMDRGETKGHWLNGPDGKAWLFLGEGGELAFIKPDARGKTDLRNRNGWASLSRDADADVLGTPTHTGIATPPKPKTAYELNVDKMKAISVATKLGMKPEDSGNLSKVAEALAKADASMFVRTTATGSQQAKWAPASSVYGGVNHVSSGQILIQSTTEAKWDAAAAGIGKYGLVMSARPSFDSPSRIRLAELKGWPAKLQANTPGVVWDVQDSNVVFVALDGGRYELHAWPSDYDKEGPGVEPGVPAVAKWAPPLQHSALDVGVVGTLGKVGALPKATVDDVSQAEDGYFECTRALWKLGRAEADKIEASPASLNDKAGKLTGIPKTYEARADRECAIHLKKYEQALVKVIEARDAERKALYEKAKARAATFAK